MRMAGRVEERRLLAEVVDRAAEGRPGAVLVHGEAGVGKTRLVSEVCADARDRGYAVVRGACVRVGAVESPYHPLLTGLEAWAADAGADLRRAVLGGASSLSHYLAVPERVDATGLTGRLLGLERLIQDLARHAPTLLVVDDLQWADLASRDLLSYLVAGFHRQRLAVLGTYRDEGLGSSEAFLGWLADLTRFPAVTDLRLGRLSASETEEQVRLLTGSTPHPLLVADLMDRAGGNAYFTELLVKALPPGAERLPDRVPEALSSALLAAWHRLDAAAREVLRVLAVAGRPVRSADLAEVAAALRLDPDGCPRALRAAEDEGIVVRDGDHFWFRHPLLVDVLEGTMTSAERGPVHTAWARRLASLPDDDVRELARQSDLARHHEAGGDLAESLAASLRAAHLAEQIGAVREVAAHLKRAVRLTRQVGGTPDVRDEVSLLERTALACDRVGEGAAALAAWTRALELVDPAADPLLASHLVVERANASWTTGVVRDKPIGEMERAVELSRAHPDSPEHAVALAELSRCESWSGRAEDAMRHARAAVDAAARSGSVLADAQAHVALGQALGQGPAADEAVRRGIEAAERSGDQRLVNLAHVFGINQLHDRGLIADAVEEGLVALRRTRSAGDLNRAAFTAAVVAKDLLTVGRLPDAAEVIREALSLVGVSNSIAITRLSAMLLAVRQGDLAAADLHLERAREVIPGLEDRPGLEAPPQLAEHLLAHGRPEDALDLLDRTLEVQSVDPRIVDDMLVWAARCAAAWAQRGRDRRDPQTVEHAQAALSGLLDRRRALPVPRPFAKVYPDDPTQPAREAWFEAERGCCLTGAASAGVWARVVELCEKAGFGWDAQVARLRLAEELSHEDAPRAAVAEPLRAVARYAREVEAAGLARSAAELAATCGIPLDEPASPAPGHGTVAAPFRELTAREREVLAHLVAGRTYAEIAAELVISEKTVSSHVSHLLRKTGTRSRRELAALVRRLDQGH